ncbi:hypothetical protein LIA77_07180 [Sarocladium implicatum]|nr:hypothetical protein LIA77_07180 [Sarocladium implicatum]
MLVRDLQRGESGRVPVLVVARECLMVLQPNTEVATRNRFVAKGRVDGGAVLYMRLSRLFPSLMFTFSWNRA